MTMIHKGIILLLLLLSLVRLSSGSWNDTCEHYLLRQDIPQPGMHLLCVKPAADSTVSVSVLKDGMEEYQYTHPYDYGDTINFFHHLYEVIGTSNNRDIYLWESYNIEGRIIWSIDRMAYEETVLIFTNGHWIWPGVREGYVWHVDGKELVTLSLSPLVFKSTDFLTDEECDYIQQVSTPHLVASTTSKMDKDRDKPDTNWRTSTQYFLPSTEHELVQDIDYRVAKLTRTSTVQQEYVQVLRYEKGQKYDQHTDYFDPQFYQSDPKTLELIQDGEKNRLITVLWYLSTVEEGGHTVFPLAFGHKPANSSDCSKGLLVPPVKKEVVVFYSLHADGSLDHSSLHGACPVGEGVKFAANKVCMPNVFTRVIIIYFVQTHTSTHTHTHTHTYTQKHKHTLISVSTHTHTHTRIQWIWTHSTGFYDN